MNRKNLLIIGSGGREHALTWKLHQSPRVRQIFIAPGNGGTAQIGINVPIPATNLDQLAAFAKEKRIDLTIVGPDDPLALGIVDLFQENGLRIFGPTRAAARIESSKAFAKDLMQKSGIPTARFEVFQDYFAALASIHEHGLPLVIKASGLALGKGVSICKTFAEAEQALTAILIDRVHGAAGDSVIIEEFLTGPEISLHAVCDGSSYALFPSAQDHKPVWDGDRGKNTGGMGAIAPVPWLSPVDLHAIGDRIIRPILDALANLGHPFRGLLYPGIILTSTGPKVLEFNARFGDPEAQVLLLLLKMDLLDVLEACDDGTLANLSLDWHNGFATCVVLASGGYPDAYQKHLPIHGIPVAERVSHTVIFHAGTIESEPGILRTSGGRVLGVSAHGPTLAVAQKRAYEAAQYISFDGMHYRRDIGSRAR